MANLIFIRPGKEAMIAGISIVMLIVFLPSCSKKLSQSYLQGVPIAGSTKLPQACTDFMSYAPDSNFPSHTPIRQVRLNFHIMRDSAGTINFDEEAGAEFVHGLVADANQRLNVNPKMTLPVGNNTPALPKRIQFVLTPDPAIADDDGIYFHYDNEFAYFNKKGPTKNTFDLRMFDVYKVQPGTVLNVFLLEHHPDSIKSSTYKSSNDGIGLNDWIKAVGLHQHAYSRLQNADGTVTVDGPYYNTNIILHEIGHSLGLAHTWNANDGCDDTPLNPGCWDAATPACKELGVYSNNMMDYNNCQCALTPCQLAKIHYNFSKEKSSQRKLLVPAWCEYKAQASINITWPQVVTWSSSKDLEGDIVIHNGGELTIQCEVSLPKGAKIIVKPKGKLILDGARITNKCGDTWNGIEIWETKRNRGEVIYLTPSSFESVEHNPALMLAPEK